MIRQRFDERWHSTPPIRDEAFGADLAAHPYPDWLELPGRYYYTCLDGVFYLLTVDNQIGQAILWMLEDRGEDRRWWLDLRFNEPLRLKEFVEQVLHHLPEILMEEAL